MAKIKMKKVTIAALIEDRKRLLEHLQDSALIQIESAEEAKDGFFRPESKNGSAVFDKNARLAEQALAILDRYAPEKKGMLDSFSGRRQVDPDDIGVIASKSREGIETCNKICELNKKCAENAASKARIKASLAQLTPWEELDIPISTRGTKSTYITIGSLPRGYNEEELSAAIAEECPELIFAFEIISTAKEQTCIVLTCIKEQKEAAKEALRSLGFARPFSSGMALPHSEAQSLRDKDKELDSLTAKYKDEITSLGEKRRLIEDVHDYFTIRADKYEVIASLDHSQHTFIITGYVPQTDCDKLESLCKRVARCELDFQDAPDDDSVPIKLKNNRFSAPAESIVTMYSTPSRQDIDPTPLLAFFYYFFFGMMFSDAGYGILMVLATAFVIKRYKPEEKMRLNLKLFQYCGISTFLWGCVFGSFFGDAPASLYNHFTGANLTMKQILPWPTVDPQKDALTLMIVSIGFGLIHILVGMGCKFLICWRQKDYKAALFDTGLWMTMLIGFALLAAGMATTDTVKNIGIYIAIASAVGLVLTQGRDKKGIGKITGGVASLYDITGYVSDLLSYSRLLALGLTTGVMAQVFNMLSTMFGTSIPSFIPLILIFVLGHLINIGLNSLGSYVHTMRLQYVEMFSKFYEGGGKPFTPFSLNSKYIRIQEENKK